MSSEITIRSIPSEVLCDIFHLLCDGPIALYDLRNELHFHEFPWAVGQVCRHWRGEFLSYTPLWTSFSLSPAPSSSTSGPYFVEMRRRAIIYLKRSGQQPLTVVVSTYCLSTDRFSTPVWELLLSCLKRWKKANLELVHGALGKLLRCTEHMSNLESLKIHMPDYMSALEDFSAFGVAPCLTELNLTIHKYRPTWQFPWAQLTKLTIDTSSHNSDDYRDSDDLWGLLSQLKNIEKLHIMTPFYFPKPPPGIICLPVLRLLEIPLAHAILFSRFTVPLLEHLHIYGHMVSVLNNDIYDGQREIASFIQRSFYHIRRLTFDGWTRREMCIIMKALDGVEELSIIDPDSHAVIQDITGLNGSTYLPKLRVLQVECDPCRNHMPLDRAVRAFSRLLEARGKGSSLASNNVVPLEKFVLRLTMYGTQNDEVLEEMHGWPAFAQVYIDGTPSLHYIPKYYCNF